MFAIAKKTMMINFFITKSFVATNLELEIVQEL